MTIDIDSIDKAFSPTHEIHEPKKFIGRYSEIENCIVGLSTEGSFITIFGLRGIGKSSIANQIKLIAEGNKTLPKMLHLDHLIPKKGFNYMVHLIRCDEFIVDIRCLVKRILLGDDQNESIFSHNKNGDKRITNYKEKSKANAGVNVSILKAGVESEGEIYYETVRTDDLIQEFRQALLVTNKDNQDKTGLIILIDEFDIIKNKSGFASLIKSCTSNFVKFGVVGIGESIEDLIEGHTSIGRQITSVIVSPMQEKELIQIIKSAETTLKGEICFTDEVIQEVVKEAEGFPYFVHLLGKECLLTAFKRNERIVNKNIYDEIKGNLINGKISLTQEFRYVETCRTSPERELLLKLFANVDSNYILIEDVYKQAKDYGIDKPSKFLGVLIDTKNIAPVLIKSRDDRNVRFADPIFKVYSKKRRNIHNLY